MAREANSTPPRQRRERGSISAEEIINGALELATDVTVDGLSMPALAKRLDLGVTSIYWYFRSKDSLLDAMTDRALQEFNIAMPLADSTKWDEGLRQHARAEIEFFRANPVLSDLLLMNFGTHGTQDNKEAFQRLEAIIATLVDTGFEPAAAMDTFYSLEVHTRGIAVYERRQALGGQAVAKAMVDTVDPHSTPLLADLLASGYEIGRTSDRIFEVGLDALIDRARRVLRASKKANSVASA